MTDLYRLVYISRDAFDGDAKAGDLALASIVGASRRNNGRADVTGALLSGTGRFAQVLEGPRAAVEATFARIQGDPRHGDIRVIQSGPTTERAFVGWSTAFVGRSARGGALWDGLVRSTGLDHGRVDGDAFCAALLALVRAEGDDAAGPAAPQPSRLDVERLRSALDAERPDRRAAPAPTPSAAAPEAEERVLRAALDEERARTTALRRDLDDARVALAKAADEIESVGRHRDIWSDRGAQMRTSLKDMREALRAAETERDALRARVAGRDGDLDTLRVHRDIWAERARALALALCREPATEPDAALSTRKARPAAVSRFPIDVAS